MKLKNLSLLLGSLLVSSVVIGAELTEPTLLEGKAPLYPEVARTAGIEGTVLVEALIDEHGQVFAADVVNEADQVLAQVTLDTIKDWKFTPATESGEVIMRVVHIPVNFNLKPMNNVESSLMNQNRALASR